MRGFPQILLTCVVGEMEGELHGEHADHMAKRETCEEILPFSAPSEGKLGPNLRPNDSLLASRPVV